MILLVGEVRKFGKRRNHKYSGWMGKECSAPRFCVGYLWTINKPTFWTGITASFFWGNSIFIPSSFFGGRGVMCGVDRHFLSQPKPNYMRPMMESKFIVRRWITVLIKINFFFSFLFLNPYRAYFIKLKRQNQKQQEKKHLEELTPSG